MFVWQELALHISDFSVTVIILTLCSSVLTFNFAVWLVPARFGPARWSGRRGYRPAAAGRTGKPGGAGCGEQCQCSELVQSGVLVAVTADTNIPDGQTQVTPKLNVVYIGDLSVSVALTGPPERRRVFHFKCD